MTASPIVDESRRRRTFAIISHPDAGKTTLTEKLLLFGGAIHVAGAVKARGEARRARSDWMKIERERGISVSSSVMMFEHRGLVFNLLDTPGHEDFDYYWGDWKIPLWIALIMQVPWRQRLDIFVIGFIVGLVIAGVAMSWGLLLSRY